MLETNRGGVAASTLLATSVVAPLTTKQVQNTKQNLNNQNQKSVNTPLATKNSNNVNTLSEVTNSTIGARELFSNNNIPNIDINYSSDGDAITIDSASEPIEADGEDLTMINSIGGVNITSIGDDAFNSDFNRQILCNSLTLPNGLSSIGAEAFSGCSGLNSITLPNGLTSIGEIAFSGCSGLNSITLPNGLTSIPRYAFSSCSGLNSITLPSGLTSIGEGAFSRCKGLTSIDLPSGLTSIGENAFIWCSGLTSIDLPSGLTSIGDFAFYRCSLNRIDYPGEETTGSGMTTQTWGTGSTTWLARSFWDSNNQLIGRMIENSDTAYTQVGCLVVGAIDISTSGWSSIGDYAFKGCSELTSISLPSGLTSIGEGAFNACSGLTSITLPNGLTSIGAEVFAACSGLTSIDLPSGVTSIGELAFGACTGLTSIDLPSGVKSIDGMAFYECSNITSMSFPSSVTSIGQGVFWMCDNLTSITFNNDTPDWMSSIDENWLAMADYFTTNVTTFYVPKGTEAAYLQWIEEHQALDPAEATWFDSETMHFEGGSGPTPPSPSTNDLNLGIALGVSLGTCIGIPGIAGGISSIVYNNKKKRLEQK